MPRPSIVCPLSSVVCPLSFVEKAPREPHEPHEPHGTHGTKQPKGPNAAAMPQRQDATSAARRVATRRRSGLRQRARLHAPLQGGGGVYELNRERGRTRLRALLVDAATDISPPLAHVKFMSSTSSAFRCRQLYHKLSSPRKCPTVPDRSGRLPSEGAYPSHGRIGRWRLHTGGRPQCITGRVAKAHEFIRKNAAARIGVPEVAAAVRVSQRMR